MLKTPSKYAKMLNLKTSELIKNIEHISTESLTISRKRTPNKYEALILGLIAKKQGITVEDILYFSNIKNEIKNKLELEK